MKKSEESLCELWDMIKRNNGHIRVVPEGEEREKGIETLLKIMAETSQIWGQRWPSKYRKLKNPQRDSTQRDFHLHIIFKFSKITEKCCKQQEKK